MEDAWLNHAERLMKELISAGIMVMSSSKKREFDDYLVSGVAIRRLSRSLKAIYDVSKI